MEPIDFEQLYRKHARTVLRRVRRFFGEAEAEEVMHEVFMRAIEKIGSFRGASSPTTWLYRLTTNHCLNRLRDQGRRRELLDEHGPFLRAGQVSAPKQEVSVFVDQLWRQLDPELVQTGVYYYVDGMTHDEVGRLMDCSPRTVGFRLGKLATQARALAGEG